jgi:hypothetical protein
MILQTGEQISARIAGRLTVKRVDTDSDGMSWAHLTYEDDAVLIDLALPVGTAIEYTRVIPADGEPQPGELWADQVGALYFAQKRKTSYGDVVLIGDKADTNLYQSWGDVHQGPTGPIHRVAERPQIGGTP